MSYFYDLHSYPDQYVFAGSEDEWEDADSSEEVDSDDKCEGDDDDVNFNEASNENIEVADKNQEVSAMDLGNVSVTSLL